MRPAVSARALGIALALGGLLGVGARPAQAQPGVPYGPYSLPRAAFDQYAPSYYPRLPNYSVPYGPLSYPAYRGYPGRYGSYGVRRLPRGRMPSRRGPRGHGFRY